MPRASYPLTAASIVASVGSGIFCLDLGALGKSYRLHADRPGPSLNSRVERNSWKGNEKRADLPTAPHAVESAEAASPLILVRIDGPLEQRAGRHDPCSAWTDGHDAVAERLIAAFAEGDVLLVGDGPGGAAAGIEQNVSRVLAAKAKYGRRCTGFADEQIASALAWWFLAVCDEIFVPPMATIGSVGARGEHMDVSGMMAREGLKKTYFADPPEKVALAAEFPLSEIGAARGMRDVSLAADAFRAAVCAGPVGQRYGLTPESLIALGADMLTGEAAVGIFADRVETLEDVTAYAIALAESGAAKIETTATGASRASTKGEGAMPGAKGLRAEGDPPAKKDGETEPESMRGTDIPTACGGCGVENDKAAKFCMGCGTSMATKPTEEPAAAKVVRAQPVAKPTAQHARASLATETEQVNARWVMSAAAQATGRTSAAEIVGALSTMPERLAAADLAVELAKIDAKAAEMTQRRALAARLGKLSLDAWQPTDIYAGPVVDGKRALSPAIAGMDLGVLTGIVEAQEKRAPKPAPFDADRANAHADAHTRATNEGVPMPGGGVPGLVDGKPTAAQIAQATKDPTVIKMFQNASNTRSIETLAENFIVAAAQNGASLGVTS